MGVESNIWKFYIFNCFSWLQFVAPIIILFFLNKDLSLAQAAIILITCELISQSLLELPSGIFADLHGLRKSLILSSILLLCGVSIYIFSSNFWILAIGGIIYGASQAFKSGADTALLYNSLLQLGRQDEFKKIRGKSHFLSYGCTAITSLAGAWFYSIDPRAPFIFGGALAVIALLTAVSFEEPKRRRVSPKVTPSYTHFKESLLFFIRQKTPLKLTFYGMVTFLPFWIVFETFYQPYLALTGLPVMYFGIAYALFRLSTALTAPFAHRIETVVGRQRLVYILPLSWSATLLFSSWFLHPLSFLILVICHVTRGIELPVMEEIYQQSIHSHHRATLLSIKNLIQSVSMGILTPVLVIATANSPTLAFTIAGVVILVLGTWTGSMIPLDANHKSTPHT